MNAEMIYANNKVMVVNEKGEYIDRVDYYDNLREVLHLKNQVEKMLFQTEEHLVLLFDINNYPTIIIKTIDVIVNT